MWILTTLECEKQGVPRAKNRKKTKKVLLRIDASIYHDGKYPNRLYLDAGFNRTMQYWKIKPRIEACPLTWASYLDSIVQLFGVQFWLTTTTAKERKEERMVRKK